MRTVNAKTTRRTRIFLADAEPLFQDGIGALLATLRDCRVVGLAGREGLFLDELKRCAPDVLIVDPRGYAVTSRELLAGVAAQRPACRIVVLNGDAGPYHVRHLLRFGACAVLSKRDAFTDLRRAIRAVQRGSIFVGPSLLRNVAQMQAEQRAPDPFHALSPRECEVVEHLSRGACMKDTARNLDLDARSVSTYRQRAFSKLGITNQWQLFRLITDMCDRSPVAIAPRKRHSMQGGSTP